MQLPGRKLSFLSSPIFWIVALSLVWAYVFARNLVPVLRGTPDWRWLYRPVQSLNRILPLILGVCLYIPLGLWLRGRRSVTGLLVWAALGSIALSLAATYVRGDILFRLYSVTASGRAEGWQMAAARIQDLPATLRSWSQFMVESDAYSPHIDHSPPGIVIIYYLFGRLLDRFPTLANALAEPLRWQLCQVLGSYTSGQSATAWLGVTAPLWAGLTVIPLYFFGRRAYGEEAARWSALWWPLIPSLLMFTPLPNTLYPLLALLVIGMLWEGLSSDRPAWVIAAGLLMSVLTFLTLTFLPLLLFAGLLACAAYWRRSRSRSSASPKWYWPFEMGLLFGIGLSVVWVIAYAASGLSLPSLLQNAQQTQAGIAQYRPYASWLALNFNDYLMFTGWPLALLALLAGWSGIRGLASRRAPGDGAILTLTLALTLLIIDASGTPRGEWGRIMLFLSPWLLLAAGCMLQNRPAAGWPITIAQGIAALVMVISLQVITIEFKTREAPVPPETAPAPSGAPIYSGSAVFGGNIRLETVSGGVTTRIDNQGNPQSYLDLWLTWDTLAVMHLPYTYSLQPVAGDGSPIGPAASVPPFTDSYPMTCWRPASGALTDQIRIPLPAQPAGGSWVDLSVIDPATRQPLTVTEATRTPANLLQIGPVPAR